MKRYPINISGEVKHGIETRIEHDSDAELLTIFDAAYSQIHHLLRSDSLPRFKKLFSPSSAEEIHFHTSA